MSHYDETDEILKYR
jgi:hypothetical protein